MRRWLFHILAAVSMMIAIAALGLWIQSYWLYDRIEVAITRDESRRVFVACISETGSVRVRYGHWSQLLASEASTLPIDLVWGSSFLEQPSGHWVLKLFEFDTFTVRWQIVANSTIIERDIIFPHWVLVLLSSIIPALWQDNRRRAKRRIRQRASGVCLRCGYDLRASTDRCGTAIPPRTPRDTASISGPP